MPAYGVYVDISEEQEARRVLERRVESIPVSSYSANYVQVDDNIESYMEYASGSGGSLTPSLSPIQKLRNAAWGVANRKREARHRINWLITSLMKVGVLNRPKGTKPLAQDYWIEKLDNKHRMADFLRMFFAQYTSLGRSEPFFDWLEGLSESQVRMVLRGVNDTMVRRFLNGVQYLDSLTRKHFVLEFKNGSILQNDELFDTAGMQSNWSGKGWAIFVMSESDDVFAASHIVGEQHHSSFLSGNPVKSAGELKVIKGRLVGITNKSGHYKPGINTLAVALKVMRDKGIAVGMTQVTMIAPNEPTQTMTGYEFLAKYP